MRADSPLKWCGVQDESVGCSGPSHGLASRTASVSSRSAAPGAGHVERQRLDRVAHGDVVAVVLDDEVEVVLVRVLVFAVQLKADVILVGERPSR